MANRIERLKMVKAMEFIARQLNDEEIFDTWLTLGVADGDIEYGDLSDADNYDLSYYTDDDTVFADLMDTFLNIMHRAYHEDSGLYCDDIVSNPAEDNDDND